MKPAENEEINIKAAVMPMLLLYTHRQETFSRHAWGVSAMKNGLHRTEKLKEAFPFHLP